jgi:osmotically-inducible protein OsmY
MKIAERLIVAAALLILPLVLSCQTMTGDSIVETPQDAALSESVRDRLLEDKKGDLSGIKVQSSGGTVYLSGTVKSLDAREHAVKMAWEVRGVQSVVNHLIVGN